MVDESGRSLKITVLEPITRRFVKFVNVFAGGFWTMAKSEDGRLFAYGLNNYGQLGVTGTDEQHNSSNGSVDGDQGDFDR